MTFNGGDVSKTVSGNILRHLGTMPLTNLVNVDNDLIWAPALGVCSHGRADPLCPLRSSPMLHNDAGMD